MPRTSSKAPKNPASVREPAWSIPSLREPRYSQSLERGLAILSCFTPKRPVLGIADIADELGMSRSTTHRYVITLLALGYLEQGASRKYRLGLRVTDLGMSALNSTGLREHAQPYLEELRQQTSYSVSLAVLDGPEILYVDRARSFRRGQGQADLDLRIGSRLPAYCTAMGKLLLANLPESDQRELIASIKLTKHGPNTITAKKALRDELDEVLDANFAVDDEELARDLYSVAAPVRDEARDVVAAVDIAVPSSMISLGELVDALGPHLVSTADRISARLGYRRDDEQG
jgi:IclR family pca regulon transcriptional regulator